MLSCHRKMYCTFVLYSSAYDMFTISAYDMYMHSLKIIVCQNDNIGTVFTQGVLIYS